MYKICIFDLDGTLTDTLDSLTFSVNETLKEMGLSPITSEQCRMFVGNGARVLMEKALWESAKAGPERLDAAMEIYGRIFDANCTYHVIPYDGILKLLEGMRARGICLAVLSNKPDRQTVRVVGRDIRQGYVSMDSGPERRHTQEAGSLCRPADRREVWG